MPFMEQPTVHYILPNAFCFGKTVAEDCFTERRAFDHYCTVTVSQILNSVGGAIALDELVAVPKQEELACEHTQE
jgi:hypothetical protein